jgi:Arc/MetJ-type ribon-helix-helix transcriptional regulator
MTFFDKEIKIRIRQEDFIQIEENLIKNKDKYENLSHFIRSAIIKQIKEDKNGE